MYKYHNGPLANSDAALSAILTSIRSAKDSSSQEPPVGYAIIGFHVDDGIGVACSVNWELDISKNRVVQYIRGTIEVSYATTLTGWHGEKTLGFTLLLDYERKTVTMSARDALERLARDLLKDQVIIQPKHVMTDEFYDIPAGEVPHESDPSYRAVMERMALTRTGLGLCIWLENAYPQAVPAINALCVNMAFPHEKTLKCLRFTVMHLLAHDHPACWGEVEGFGLEQPEDADMSNPYASRPSWVHFYSDASLSQKSITGGVAMLARGPILTVSQRQHLQAPCAHTSEVVAAGSNLNFLIPINGLLQELSIRLGAPTPFYLDSATTVFVSNKDTSIKKSVWVIRRAAVITDGTMLGEIKTIHIPEYDMLADPFTKYLKVVVWLRHMHYLLNLSGPVPSRGK